MSESGLLTRLQSARQQVKRLLVGKPDAVDAAFACLLAGGHLLIEDIPGVGKTTLAHSLAITLGLDWQRIQFTSDMLPADILGVSVYQRQTDCFEYHPGPIFHQLLLADEINRGTAKTQSALLEAMAEKRVTVDGKTRSLPQPFFVIATQNPLDTAGTFPLPDSQRDRFLLCIQLGYPDHDSERQLLTGDSRASMLQSTEPVLASTDLDKLQRLCARIHHSGALLDYLQALLVSSRQWPAIRHGLSPRAGLALLHCAKAYALMAGRDHCLPEDIQRAFPDLCRHRLRPAKASEDTAAADILASVAVVADEHQSP